MQQEDKWDLYEDELSLLQQIQRQKQLQLNSIFEDNRKQQLRSEAKTNHMQCQTVVPSCLKQSKRELIVKLLEHLQCHQTKIAFQKQIRSSEGDKNPEEVSAMKRQAKIKKGKSNQKLIEQMIRTSSNYQELLDHLQHFYCQSDKNQEMRDSQWRSKVLEKKLEKLIRTLEPQRRQAMIPKYHNVEIKQDSKQVILIDINSSEDIVFLDSEFYVHVIPSEGGDVKPFKLQKKKQIVLLKWMNQSSFALINNRGRIALFVWNERQLTLRHQFHLQLPRIKLINIYFDIEHGSRKIYIKILTVDQSSQFTANLLSIGVHEIRLLQSISFSLKNSYTNFILLTNNQYGEQTLKYDHYLGITTDQSFIFKLDTFTKRQGLLWRPKSNEEILKEIMPSKCKQYLYALVCKRTRQLFEEDFFRCQDYEFIRMDEKGGCLQRIPLLLGDLKIYNCRTSLTNMTLLDPEWLCCLISDKNICYFSLVTGKLLFSHDIGKGTLTSIKSGALNTIIYQAKNIYGLLSIQQRQMKRINLCKKQLVRDRQSLILQLTMRNGIPQTLLQLLQELRNNQYER